MKNCFSCKHCKPENLYETCLWCNFLKNVKWAEDVHNCKYYENIDKTGDNYEQIFMPKS